MVSLGHLYNTGRITMGYHGLYSFVLDSILDGWQVSSTNIIDIQPLTCALIGFETSRGGYTYLVRCRSPL